MRNMRYIFRLIKQNNCEETIFYRTFGGVHSGCDTLCWERSIWNENPWSSKSPPEELWIFTWIHVHSPLHEYGQYSPETCSLFHYHKVIIWQEVNQVTQSALSLAIDDWMAITWIGSTSCRVWTTRAILVWLQLVPLNSHWWTSQLMIRP
jgi:hypothetical protein